jgi:hypothetical protein
LLNPDYKDILSIFNDEKVDYLVVGAYALAAHGLPPRPEPSIYGSAPMQTTLAAFGKPWRNSVRLYRTWKKMISQTRESFFRLVFRHRESTF